VSISIDLELKGIDITISADLHIAIKGEGFWCTLEGCHYVTWLPYVPIWHAPCTTHWAPWVGQCCVFLRVSWTHHHMISIYSSPSGKCQRAEVVHRVKMSGLWWFKQQLKGVLCREYPLADRELKMSEWALFEQPSVSSVFHCPTTCFWWIYAQWKSTIWSAQIWIFQEIAWHIYISVEVGVFCMYDSGTVYLNACSHYSLPHVNVSTGGAIKLVHRSTGPNHD
jgi:hypothetical protein